MSADSDLVWVEGVGTCLPVKDDQVGASAIGWSPLIGRTLVGTDVHLVAEVREGDRWEMVEPAPEACEDCDGTGHYLTRHRCYFCADPDSRGYLGMPGTCRVSWFDERNYFVFGVLAGIRGVATPIVEPRGFPSDLSEGALAWFAAHGGDHTASWLLLTEVLAVDWGCERRLLGSGWRGVDAGVFPERMRLLAEVAAGRPCRLVFDFDS